MTSAPPHIREMRSEDAERVADLCTQLGYPSVAADVLERLSAMPADGSHAAFVAERDGAVAGWVHVFLGHAIEADPRAEVMGMVVDQSARRGGVGRALMARAEAWARDRGVNRIVLRSNVVRKEAHQFYRALGYNITKSQYTFVKELAPGGRGPAA